MSLSWGETCRLELRYSGGLRGQLEHLPRLATVVRREREQHPGLLLLDAGDFSRGTALCEEFHGLPAAEVFNELGYAAVGLGEAEAGWSLAVLRELAVACRFPLLAANWSADNAPWQACARLTLQGLSVVVVGLAPERPPEGVRLTAPAVEVEPSEVAILVSWLPSLAGVDLDPYQVVLEGGHGGGAPYRVGPTLVVPADLGPGMLGSLGLDLTGTLVIGDG